MPGHTIELQDAVSIVESRERADAELVGERGDPSLRRPDPLSAELDDLPRRDLGGEEATPDAPAGLEHHGFDAGRDEVLAAVSPASPAPTTIASVSGTPSSSVPSSQ